MSLPDHSSILVIGGAGFIGSNFVRESLDQGAGRVLVVDNFLSSERANIPEDSRLELIEGSIADDAVLARIDDEWDYVFHLATYHGNQSSIADPLADRANNLLTTAKLVRADEGLPPCREGRLRRIRVHACGTHLR